MIKVICIIVCCLFYCSMSYSQENNNEGKQGVCIRLGQRTIGAATDRTFYQVTVIGTRGESTTLTSLPLKNDFSTNPSYYYFHAKDVSELKAIKLTTVTMTRGHGPLQLSCSNMLIQPHAKSADIAIQQDNWDKGECLLSVTPYQSTAIVPCHNGL
jgi:hypothetical protein